MKRLEKVVFSASLLVKLVPLTWIIAHPARRLPAILIFTISYARLPVQINIMRT